MSEPIVCYKCCFCLWKKNGVLVCPCGVPTTTYVAPEYSAEELAKRNIERDNFIDKLHEDIFKDYHNFKGSFTKRSRDRVIFTSLKLSKKPHRKSSRKERKEPEVREGAEDIWNPPREGCFKVNIAGSLRKKRSGGYGAIVRDHTGKTIAAAAGVSVAPVSTLYHTLEGVLKGLQLAKKCECRKLSVDIDSNNVCGILWKNYGLDPADCHTLIPPILDRIDKLASEFEFCDFDDCPRPCNKAADYLSKLHEDIKFDVKKLPTELSAIVDRDARSSLEKDARW
ncbi:hypothetical protein ACHQM5_019634 [Ranunculus cassubicifolius]